MPADFRIRPAEPRDAQELTAMVKELLVHLGDSLESFNDQRFRDDAFGESPACPRRIE